MARYRCPTCGGRPLRPRFQLVAPPRCGHCGGQLSKLPAWRSGYALLLAGFAAGTFLVALPSLRRQLLTTDMVMAWRPLPRLLAHLETMPEPQGQPVALLAAGLYEQLAEGDRKWLPVVQPLPGGGTRFVYRRRHGEPELTLAQIRQRLNDPPRYERERQEIHRLLLLLQRARVRVVLETPRKPGAAAEWDHAARTMRIRHDVPEQGTLDFAQVLNHEAIHVAQSCASGSLRTRPRALGLSTRLDSELERHLHQPLYADTSQLERLLEKEAYANQHRLGLGASLVEAHCPLTG
jgi:hypothetical protein